jgi:hypothetical protein
MPCDPKCYELAQYFYPRQDGIFLTELAEAVQELIEDMNPEDSEESL